MPHSSRPHLDKWTIGSPSDMASFQTAFLDLMRLPTNKLNALAAQPHPYPHLISTPAC